MWCLRRRNLMMRTLSARPWATTLAVTLAPLRASPILIPSLSPSIRMSSNLISEPASASSFSTRSVSPCATRYCLPPVTRTAYMTRHSSVVIVVKPARIGADRSGIVVARPSPGQATPGPEPQPRPAPPPGGLRWMAVAPKSSVPLRWRIASAEPPTDGCHQDPRRADTQPQEPRPRPAPRQADRDHRPVRLRQVLAGVRHDLRGRPAALRRVAVGLCPPVPVGDGKARCRPHRGPVPGDLDRAEVDLARPALYRRHDHRDLRLPAPAVRAGGHPALPGPRLPTGGPDRRPDGRPGAGAGPGAALDA